MNIFNVISQFDAKMQHLRQNYSAFEVLQGGFLSLVEFLEIVDNVNLTLQNLKDTTGILVSEQQKS